MSDRLKIIRVFIGSPGGLDDERQTAHEVVASVNRAHSESWGCYFKLLGWEDAVPGYVRPQSKINEDLDRCDYFIGVLWNKWGSRPSNDPSGYTSGFEEEYERSKARIESGLMKDMAIYFKVIEVPNGMEPGDEIKKVLDFRRKCVDEKKVFFKPFLDIQSFSDVIREKLEEIGWRETDIFSEEEKQEGQSNKAPTKKTTLDEAQTQPEWLIEEEGRSFLTEIMQRPPTFDSTTAHEIARLRLIGTAVSTPGNNDFYLGNHDANLVFRYFRDAPLSEQEIDALVNCGVVGFDYQNAPLWKWIVRSDVDHIPFYRLRILATVGNDREQKNAIRILELMRQPLPTHDSYFNKHGVLTSWFAEETDNQVFEAAISFLIANGEHDDVSFIEEASIHCTPQRKNKVEGAIVGIIARTNVDAALKRMCDKEVDKVDGRVIEELFKAPKSLATATLRLCLAAKPDDVRLRAAHILFVRNEILTDTAHTLLTDTNHEIRLIAAETLNSAGQPLEEEILEKVLTAEKQMSGFGFIRQKETDSTFFRRYRINRLSELSMVELRKEVEDKQLFVDRELSVLYSKFKSKTQAEMRQNLADGFVTYFDTSLKKVKARFGAESKIVANAEKLGSFYRGQLCSSTLASLCDLRHSSDLELVRKAVDRYDIAVSSNVLKYFARFGDWQDIERVQKLGTVPSGFPDFLNFNESLLYSQKADTIFELGKQRIADVLALDLDLAVRTSLLKRLPKKVFRDLDDDTVLRELERKENENRVVFALRCVQSLPKSRIISLLNSYIGNDRHRYYNSVHWLDLGASLPSKVAKTVAERELSRH